jgi:hypothetical protein
MNFLPILATLLAGASVVAALPSDLAAAAPNNVDTNDPSIATATTAADGPTATHSLAKRLTVLDPPPRNVICGNYAYSAADVEASARDAYAHRNQPVGTGRYPHRLRNMENLRGFNRACNPHLLQEFPLTQHNRVFPDGGPPGTDRVVVHFISGDVRYCGTITHKGAPRPNGIVACSPIFR